ncbi:putative cytoplasmic protein [Pseudomonas sp. M47T1]|uniref:DUF1376 domain-containing protein n=1 Tax=Pseudomonas sp. M47T1 TaxID=1179778 RepID=UPI0002607DFA|nr:DUF1376 domain-containing protein [Pseudomonas sp. M47T1]EIK94031.1 putative cytoplasmic protein [Pseudomonas sp. M47T1]
MTEQPSAIAPLVPAEVELRGLEYMPLDVVRLLDSDLYAISTGEEFKTALALWCKSWQQQPTASLPNDDRILAHLSGTGSRWKKVKTMALRGWVLCSDNRLYHPVIAEKAMAAWHERVEYRDKRENEAERQRRHREDHKALRARLREFGVTVPYNTSMASLQEMLQYQERERPNNTPVTSTGPSHDTERPWLRREEKGREEKLLNQKHVHQGSASEDEPPMEVLLAPEAEGHHYPGQPALPIPEANAASGKAPRVDPMVGFADFYKLYPRKQKRADAEKAWRKLAPDEELRATITGSLALHYQSEGWRKDQGQFIPLPASWLNSRRWEDVLGPIDTLGCPAEQLVELYHQHCPTLAPVTVLDTFLRQSLSERWAEHEAQQDLGFWVEFFQQAAGLDTVFYRGEHRRPYLEALVIRQNFRDLVEGHTHA